MANNFIQVGLLKTDFKSNQMVNLVSKTNIVITSYGRINIVPIFKAYSLLRREKIGPDQNFITLDHGNMI